VARALAAGVVIALVAVALVTACDGAARRPATIDGPPGQSVVPPAPPAAATPRPTAAPPTAAAHIDEAGFWSLVERSRADAGGDTGRQTQLLEERLARMPASAIADFGALRRRLDDRAYRWDLWGAAYVIEDGCSDDCFRDFRAYLIALGRPAYEAALRDPDSLAGVVQDAETGDWENADEVASEAYEHVTGEDLPAGDSEPSGDPRGTPWDDEQADELVRRYPRLAARFR
jgi:Protein of unknown function (DUF4240)